MVISPTFGEEVNESHRGGDVRGGLYFSCGLQVEAHGARIVERNHAASRHTW